MNRLFGSKNKAPPPSLGDATSRIDSRIADLDVKLSTINTELSTYQQRLAKMRDGPGKQAIKQKALKLLQKRKQIEAQKDQLDSQSWNLTQAQMTTDNLQNTMITVNAMKETSKQLKKTYGKLDVDKLEDLQDEMLDMIERANELQSVLGQGMGLDVDEISEGELDAELEALGDEMELEEAMGETPSYLTSNVPTFIDEQETEAEGQKMAAA